ncbi:MAG: DinB family protein [Fimbriimonadaceae bacterium]
MSTQDFIKTQLEDSGKQLTAVFTGIPVDKWDEKVTEHAFSAKETANHLADCYNAFLTAADGGEHEWGSTIIEDQSPDGLTKAMFDLRTKCADQAGSTDDPKIHHLASEYICLHDAYHVGQMVTLRMKLGDFDPYSIYK